MCETDGFKFGFTSEAESPKTGATTATVIGWNEAELSFQWQKQGRQIDGR